MEEGAGLYEQGKLYGAVSCWKQVLELEPKNEIASEYLRFIDERFPGLAMRVLRRATLPEEAHDLHWITSQAAEFIERQVAAGRPFLCSCSFHELCPPSNPPEGFAGTIDPAGSQGKSP